MEDLAKLLCMRLANQEYVDLILKIAQQFSVPEQDLLQQILIEFEFNPIEEQALMQAVLQQSRFDPNAMHIEEYDDEDTTAICPHCINPPKPPLRDYQMWRTR